jgi:hypothetical protein
VSERPIIVRQSQTQGCCAGTGCGTVVALALALAALGVLLEAVAGKHGVWWQVGSVTGIVLLVLLLALAGLGYLDERRNPPEPGEAPPGFAGDEANYGLGCFETGARSTTKADVDERLRRLAKLRDDGIVTAQEFEAKKRALLDEL